MIDLLILLLIRINLDSSINVINKEYTTTHPLVNAAKYIAGQCLHINNIHTVMNAGFTVVPDLLSKYGWKTSYIILNRGIITYRVVFPIYV